MLLSEILFSDILCYYKHRYSHPVHLHVVEVLKAFDWLLGRVPRQLQNQNSKLDYLRKISAQRSGKSQALSRQRRQNRQPIGHYHAGSCSHCWKKIQSCEQRLSRSNCALGWGDGWPCWISRKRYLKLRFDRRKPRKPSSLVFSEIRWRTLEIKLTFYFLFKDSNIQFQIIIVQVLMKAVILSSNIA